VTVPATTSVWITPGLDLRIDKRHALCFKKHV
jgi:hypothetical protein